MGCASPAARSTATDLTLATEDHNTPTDYTLPLIGLESIKDEVSRTQIATLR